MLQDLRELFADDRLWVLTSREGVAVTFDTSGPRALLVFTSAGSASFHADAIDHSTMPDHSVCEMTFGWLQGFFMRLFDQGLVDALTVDLDSFFDFRTAVIPPTLGWVEERGTSFSEDGMWAGGAILVVKVSPDLEWTIAVPEAPSDPNGLAAELLGTLATREPALA
ncbi:hypothetical protein CMI47_17965 [Candidatus Pacearchaeota archaeon]|nr:hypothetical protein [Candidatus Pacearchaeota archaeon]